MASTTSMIDSMVQFAAESCDSSSVSSIRNPNPRATPPSDRFSMPFSPRHISSKVAPPQSACALRADINNLHDIADVIPGWTEEKMFAELAPVVNLWVAVGDFKRIDFS